MATASKKSPQKKPVGKVVDKNTRPSNDAIRAKLRGAVVEPAKVDETAPWDEPSTPAQVVEPLKEKITDVNSSIDKALDALAAIGVKPNTEEVAATTMPKFDAAQQPPIQAPKPNEVVPANAHPMFARAPNPNHTAPKSYTNPQEYKTPGGHVYAGFDTPLGSVAKNVMGNNVSSKPTVKKSAPAFFASSTDPL